MTDTIVAISTALGQGAISIVRLSGSEAIDITNKIFKGKDLTKVNSHTINYGHICDKDELIDEVLVSVMKAPKTFTTEDVVEINCHGGIATTNRVLELLISKGARLAEPGEFTKRAFLNHRIDLVEAEAITDLINSKTDKARQLSMNQASGRLSNLIGEFRQYIVEILANIEVNIDYPEYEDVEEFTITLLKDKIKVIKDKLETILKESQNGKIIQEGIKVVIVGKPNVGKSSLLNKLLQEDKAIVTNIEGTTRDIVEGSLSLDGILIHLIDTAGLRETTNIIEQKGIERTKEELEKADLVLVVLDSSREVTDGDIEFIKNIKQKVLIVMNKDDLLTKENIPSLSEYDIISTNTITNDGIEALKNKIISIFNLDKIESKDLTYMSNARQIGLIKESIDIIGDIERSIDEQVPIDIIEIDLKRIWEKLGQIIGVNYDNELIDQLFSQFCLGK